MSLLAFVFKLNERDIRSVLLPIGTETSYIHQQVVPTILLVIDVLSQLDQVTSMVTQSNLQTRKLSRTLSFHHYRSHWWIPLWSTLSRGAYLEPPREERGAEKLPCPLAGVSTLV